MNKDQQERWLTTPVKVHLDVRDAMFLHQLLSKQHVPPFMENAKGQLEQVQRIGEELHKRIEKEKPIVVTPEDVLTSRAKN